MNIIKERDKRNAHRRRMKDEYDSVMRLSVQESDWVPLLQEGMVTYGDGTPWFYIMRGALRNYMDELPEDYEGSINIGHTDMASFPERIVGRWDKSNMRLVDIGDNRQRLETNLPLNHNHPLVQALEQAEFDVGLSVEMSTEVNEELTNNQELNPFGVPVVERLFVYDYAIVGDAGDVNSMGIHLKGGTKLQMNDLAKLLEKEGGDNLAEITKLLEANLSTAEEEASEQTNLEAEPEAEEAPEVPEELEVEPEAEEAEPEAEPEVPEDLGAEPEAAPEAEETESFQTILSQLAAELKSLREENASLKEKLASKEAAEAEFVKKFKNLAVSLTATPKAAPAEEPKVYTDGIGE